MRRFRSEEFKSGFFGTAQDILDEAIATAADAGRAEAALKFAERGQARAARSPDRPRRCRGAGTGRDADLCRPPGPGAAARRAAQRHSRRCGRRRISRARPASFAWVLRPGELRQVGLPIGRAAIGVAVQGFVASIVAEAADTQSRAAALHRTLVAPLGLGGGEALLVVPYEALHLLPFAALQEGRSWLIERRAVATLPSLNALDALLKAPGAAPARALVLGNPDLGDPADASPARRCSRRCARRSST